VSQQVGQANVNGTKLGALTIPVPPERERSVLISRVSTALERARSFRREQTRWVAGVGQLDNAILAKAFRGELVPQDPNDEPADVMLARLRAATAEQADASPSKRKTTSRARKASG
jgi:type I restriction enzyme S subunit